MGAFMGVMAANASAGCSICIIWAGLGSGGRGAGSGSAWKDGPGRPPGCSPWGSAKEYGRVLANF